MWQEIYRNISLSFGDLLIVWRPFSLVFISFFQIDIKISVVSWRDVFKYYLGSVILLQYSYDHPRFDTDNIEIQLS